MHVIASPELDRFREEVRDWLTVNRPTEPRPLEGEAMRAFDLAWQRRQFEGGWAGIAWPKDYGGRGLSLLEQLIWYEEYARSGAPTIGSMFVALSHAGPTLIMEGSDAQKAEHLPKILRGEVLWCQGFSEPGAGSDLAAVSTQARVEGDHLVVNGSKIWTTYGQVSEIQELLVRTGEGPRHKGLSWVICDMDSPGITIRPIKAMSGLTHFCQVFYDDVRIPLTNVVGGLGQGWRVAMTTLSFERGSATISHQIELARTVERLTAAAAALKRGEGEIWSARLDRLRAEVAALRSLTALAVSRGLREAVPGPEGNITALYFAELARKVHVLAIEMLEADGLERDGAAGDWPLNYFEAYKWGIGGGTLEIRRNAIAERLLGLPKLRTA
jgi:alkylation response protein AidB-like acyl-CoA dehydrogenase